MAESKQKIRREDEKRNRLEEMELSVPPLPWPNGVDVQSATFGLLEAFKYALRGCLGFLGCP